MGNLSTNQGLMIKIYQNPKYKGRHIIAIAGQVFSVKTAKAKSRLLDKLLKKYPKETPTITYVPKADSLVLIEL